MSGENISLIVTLIIFIANMVLLFQIFQSRFDIRVSAGILALFTTGELFVELLLGPLRFDYAGLRGLLYFPLLLFLLKGTVFQKLFAFSLELVFTVSVSLLLNEVVKYILGNESSYYPFVSMAVVFVFCIAYVIIVTINRRIIYEKLFAYGSKTEWAIYSFVGLTSFVIMSVSRMTETRPLYFIAIMLFILLSFGVLCFAIVSTHEKSKQRYEAEFARNVISSGHDHYRKMDEMYDKLRIMRHDYKYHLNVARRILSSGSFEEANEYLTGVENRLSENELQVYCANTVINALVAGYAERCGKQNIKFSANLKIPEPFSVQDYDMCIILGNLLENAIEACEKLESNRVAELVVKSQGTQLVIVVRNSFDGRIIQGGKTPMSIKKDGGLGLRSVAAVAARYGGELITEWNTDTFTTYVTVRL